MGPQARTVGTLEVRDCTTRLPPIDLECRPDVRHPNASTSTLPLHAFPPSPDTLPHSIPHSPTRQASSQHAPASTRSLLVNVLPSNAFLPQHTSISTCSFFNALPTQGALVDVQPRHTRRTQDALNSAEPRRTHSRRTPSTCSLVDARAHAGCPRRRAASTQDALESSACSLVDMCAHAGHPQYTLCIWL
jgi:hypothetical protein